MAAVALPIALGATACAKDTRDGGFEDEENTSGPEPSDDTTTTDTGDAESSSDSGPPQKLDLGVQADSSGGMMFEEECAEFSDSAIVNHLPADILWVVDNSPSMYDEAVAVQGFLNEFSEQITVAGIDIRVFLLTAFPPTLSGICIEPPLGGGACPLDDNNYPVFGHLGEFVGSHNALYRLIGVHPGWAPIMREEAAKHIVIVSDDDSHMTAESFDQFFTELDPSYEGYTLHGIVPTTTCNEAQEVGQVYIDLAEQTGGVIGDLCLQEFGPLFQALTEAVADGTPLSCEWLLPEAPEGRVIDPNTVEVTFEGDGDSQVLPPVDEQALCAVEPLGWYFDNEDEPTTVIACPEACQLVQGASDANIIIDVGCAVLPEG